MIGEHVGVGVAGDVREALGDVVGQAHAEPRALGGGELAAGDVAQAVGPGDAAAITDRVALMAALDDLAPKARAAVVLRYYHDLD